MDALQAACVALHAPPTGPEAESRRAEAESVLEHFKRSPSALNDAMSLLRDSQTPPVVQFHCVATIREVTLQRWPLLALPDKSQALDFLMQLLLERGAAAPRFVAAAALQTAVLLVKRGWLDRLESERSAVLQQMGTMLQPGNAIAHRLLAAKWLLAFVTEFSSASRASNMMQPVEFHTKSRRTLEKSGGLKDIVALAVPLLEDSIRSTTTACGDAGAAGDVPAEQLELLDSAFRLCVELLNWQFEDPRVGNLTWSLTVSASDDDTGNRPVLVPQASWRPILVRPDLIHSAFNTYAFFRNVAAKNETLLHLARQFLIQLASLQGPIFERKTEQVQFLGEIFRGVVTVVHNPFLDLLAHSDITGYELATRELIDCCQLLFRLVNNIGLTALLQASSGQLLSSFIDELASLTSKLLHSALERIQRHLRENPNEAIDELWELEGVDILLDAWVALANDPQLLEVGVSKTAKPEAEQALALLSKASAPVVELYLQVQLELCAVEVLAEQDEDEDVEDNAASSAREQYELAAALARLNGSASASLLVSLLQSLMNSIQQELTKLQGRDEMTPVLSQLFEKLHFVLLFAGLLLADDFEGERPGIPDRVYVTLQGVANAGESPVVSLIMLIMSHVLEFETTRLAQSPGSDCVSPFVSEGLIKTITRLCATYLAPNILVDAGEVAPALLQVFGFQNGGRAGELLNFLVQKATVYLLHWPTQPVVMENLIEFLLVLSNTRAINAVLSSEMWQSLVQANASAGSFITGAGGNTSPLNTAVARVPANLRGQLTEALCRAGMASTDQNMRAAHFQAVSQPLAQRLQQLIAMPNFESKQTANDVRVQEELKLLVETYSGIARSAESASHAPITAFCLPALPVIVKIFQIFQGDSQIVNLILNFFCVLVEAQLCYLSPRDALQVYTASDDLIRAYCRHNLGKKSMLGDAEEENYVDLLALLTLLSHLVSKDFIDFSEDATTQQEQADATRASSVVADVVFSGLRQVIPLMTEQLLAYPSLSKQYFTLVTYMVEVYAEKLVSLPSELFQMLLHSLLIGMRHVSVDVVRNSFQALSELASYHWKALQSQRPGLEAHRQQNPDMFMAFLRVIFHMALFEDFNPAILDACAGTLYPLILIEQARYSALAEEISREQTSMDTASQQRLAAAFAELITFLSPADIATGTATTRRMRTQFKTNLYAFVAEVRGFLQVK
ncbi:exportin-4, putative [Phytophthora infestans T30-4]|uniref:Exportin-4 n=2 Tax=Phytophthora infestans TaxID=4787 RepID=D0N7J5_PHYIT|nr:exportin-4, putative [Phytophthora infestans T30-4]EEY53544.1 exportin-4, putative [Phytophthora infestans T30-4]KAF4140607.1 CRM1 C terminal [Phytophthora infestans]|eukprot:XP_002905162.1 exportin-4, putative [Phytophthora infestans T30-4]